MSHIDEGELTAYADGAWAPEDAEAIRIAAHLAETLSRSDGRAPACVAWATTANTAKATICSKLIGPISVIIRRERWGRSPSRRGDIQAGNCSGVKTAGSVTYHGGSLAFCSHPAGERLREKWY